MFNLFSYILVFIYLVVILYSINKKKKLDSIFLYFFTIYVNLELFTGAGYFIKLGSLEILYSEAGLLVLFFVTLLLLPVKKASMKSLGKFLLFLLVVGVSLVLPIVLRNKTLVLPFDEYWEGLVYGDLKFSSISFSSHSLLLVFRIIIMGVVLTFGKNILFSKENILFILEKIYKVCVFYCILFVIEVAFKYVINPMTYCNLVNTIFGSGAGSYLVPTYRGGLCSLQGLYKEPSHLALGMFFASIILICWNYYHYNKKNYLIIFILNLYSVMTMSLTSFLFVIAIILLINRFGKRSIKFSKLVIGGVTLVVALVVAMNVPYFSRRFDSIFHVFELIKTDNLNRSQFTFTSGEVPRIASIVYNIKWFIQNPLFGVGLGNTYSHSFICSMLSNIGLLGVVTWWIYLKEVRNVGKLEFVTGLTFLVIFSFQGFLGYLYSIHVIYILLIYLSIHNEKRFGNARWYSNCQL